MRAIKPDRGSWPQGGGFVHGQVVGSWQRTLLKAGCVQYVSGYTPYGTTIDYMQLALLYERGTGWSYGISAPGISAPILSKLVEKVSGQCLDALVTSHAVCKN